MGIFWWWWGIFDISLQPQFEFFLIEHYKGVFKVIDESDNNDLTFDDFVSGLEIYGDDLKAFTKDMLHLIFTGKKMFFFLTFFLVFIL